jgi:glycosyltransferase involved in cell wall biosynthesis
VRVLHVGWGFRPFRAGGLIAYVEDLVRAQADRGHEVAYFFSGRHLPHGRPHLRRWRRDGVEMLELWNGPVTPSPAGTLTPWLDLDEPVSESAFDAVLERMRPDVVHVQELVGLPSSLLELPGRHGIPVVLSLEDYQLLCPTLKLFDADGRNCRRGRPGRMCRVCCAHAPDSAAPLVRRTLEDMLIPGGERGTMVANNVLNAIRFDPRVRRAQAALRPSTDTQPAPPARAATSPATAEDYDRRRLVNVQRMNGVAAVLAMSTGVADLCRELGVEDARLRVLHFTLTHVAKLVPSPRAAPADPMVFTTLNGCSSVEKGLDVVLEALAQLSSWGLGERFRLHVWGFVAPGRRDELHAHPAVELKGNYTDSDLDRMLAGADVGIVPSIWEEAYGYTGVEMLAAGVPVIGNARGGIPDYVLPGKTGWLNETAGGAELAGHMRRLIGDPHAVEELRTALRRRRPASVKPMARHVDEIEAVYRGLVPAAR